MKLLKGFDRHFRQSAMATVGQWPLMDVFDQQLLEEHSSDQDVDDILALLEGPPELSRIKNDYTSLTAGSGEEVSSEETPDLSNCQAQFGDWQSVVAGQLASDDLWAERYDLDGQAAVEDLLLASAEPHLATELDQWLVKNCPEQLSSSNTTDESSFDKIRSHAVLPVVSSENCNAEIQTPTAQLDGLEKRKRGTSDLESNTLRNAMQSEDSCRESFSATTLNETWALDLSFATRTPCNPLGKYVDVFAKRSEVPDRSLEIVQMSSSKWETFNNLNRKGNEETTNCKGICTCGLCGMPKFDFELPKIAPWKETGSVGVSSMSAQQPLVANSNGSRETRPADMSARLAALVAASSRKPTVKAALVSSAESSPDIFPGLPKNVIRQRTNSGQSVDGRPVVRSRKGPAANDTCPPVDPMVDTRLSTPGIGQTGNKVPGQLLRKQLIAFAEAIAMDEQPRVRSLISVLRDMVSPAGDALQRLAYYFMDALWARTTASGAERFNSPSRESAKDTRLSMELFFDRLPYIQFSTEAVNSSIFEGLAGHQAVHIVDFGIWQGGQWPALMERLAKQPGGAPSLRITAVDCPTSSGKDHAKPPPDIIKAHLTKIARNLGMLFEYCVIEFQLDHLDSTLFGIRDGEALAFSCCLRLRNLYDATVVRCNPRDIALQSIRLLKPAVVAIAEMDCDTNGFFFMARYKEALDYYGSVLNSLDAAFPGGSSLQRVVERNLFAREITNVVACEGLQRVVRCENLEQWRDRMIKAGFQTLPISPQTISGLQPIVQRCAEGFSLQRRNGAVTLNWKGKSLLFVSAWKPPDC